MEAMAVATVFIVHDSGGKNYLPAQKFGQLKVLLSGEDGQAFDTTHMVQKLCTGLADFQEQDYLILSGDPVAIGIACMCVADKFDVINLLKWDRQEGMYIHAQVDLTAVRD